jgi:hypothetical protein
MEGLVTIHRILLYAFLVLAVFPFPSQNEALGQVPTPAQIIGFEPGADHVLADYDQIRSYFHALDRASDRVIVEQIGTTTLGKPMLLAFISSQENLRNRERFREINRRLALAEGLTDAEARTLAEEGRATVWIDGGLHSTELAPPMHTPKLAYWLATDESEEAQNIRDNVILLLMPNMNPDGLDIVTDWYRQNLGTPFETAPLPELYHHYVGHDNNRDAYMFTQLETQAVANILYHEWFPQIFYNHHQTGPFPGRIWVPPAIDPLNHHLDPLIVSSYSHIGQYMLQRFMKEGKPGVTTSINYRVAWSAGFMHAAPQFHNILGLFTETALYSYATPHYYTDEEIGETFSRGVPLSTRDPSMQYPVPWEGGWWRIGDAVEYNLTASKAVLDVAAQLKQNYLHNIYHMGKRQIDRGHAAEGGPFAYVIDPTDQHDPGAAVELAQVFLKGGITVHQAETDFRLGDRQFSAGTYVIPPQAFRPFVIDLMEPKQYRDRFDYPGGPPERPYDVTGYNLPDQLGVQFYRAVEPFEMPGPALEEATPPAGGVHGSGSDGYLFSRARNVSVLAANRLLASGARLAWTTQPVHLSGQDWPAGTFVVTRADRNTVQRLAAQLGLDFFAFSEPPEVPVQETDAPRVGIYQSYVSNMAEGWTRWVLDQYEFQVEALHDEDIQSGDLSRFDIILLPDQDGESILNGHAPLTMPPRYAGGVGVQGAANLKRFVEDGGWLLAFHHSVEFATTMFGLPVRNSVAGVDSRQFYAPGSLIRFEADPTDLLAYGMAATGAALFWQHGMVMDIVPPAGEQSSAAGDLQQERDLVVYTRFPEKDILADGWVIGEDRHLAGRPAAMRVPLGQGQIVLIGFRPDTRGQSRNAFKLLFNPLFAAASR